MHVSTRRTSAILTSTPKILVAGTWMWPWYHEAFANALESLGCPVERFGFLEEFYRWEREGPEPIYKSTWAGLQNRLLSGPALRRINRRLLLTVQRFQPDVVWLHNCMHIYPDTVRELKRILPGSVMVQSANDNPFGDHVKPDIWRHFKRSIREFDVHFVYRHSNEADFRRMGARDVHLFRSYYIPREEYRVEPGPGEEVFRSDVIFAGHYEADGRLEALESIARTGCRLNLFGGGWGRARGMLSEDSPFRERFPVRVVVDEEYRKAISGAKIALCFLSKINRDTYTRRNFQIPAMKTFMLSEYSEDLASLFAEGEEAEYFRSREELLEKIDFYLRNELPRERIALKGHERLVKDGHDVTSRMRDFLRVVWRGQGGAVLRKGDGES